MRRHFFGKDHKQAKSLKLQKQLQEEEDAKWAEELARRREQERLDEELARKLQEELEQENNEQPGTASLGSPQVQQSSPSTPSNPNNNPSTPPPLPSKPRAYVSSSSSSTNQTAATSSARASQPATAPAPSFSSTSVVPDRERPVAARPSPSSNLTSSADTLPPPYAVHRNHHGANSSQMSLPSLPPRQSTPQPSSSSTTHTGGYPPPSAPSFANTTPAPITQAQERPITPISHASSPMPPANYMQNQQPSTPSYQLGAPPPQQHSSSSSYQTSAPQQQPSTLSYQSSAPQQQQQQQQPIYSHANAPTTPVMNGTPSNGYPPSYPNVTPAPQSYSPKAPPAVPSPTNVDPQQFTPPSGYAPQQPPPSYTTMPVPHVKTITASTIPTNTAARPTVDPPNKYPSEPSMGATLFGQQQPRREPMMFVPPPQAVTTADQYTPPTPTAATATDRHHHHRPPQSRQYMSMPVPDPAGYRASPRQTPASAATTSASLSSMKPPQQQQGTATHISPLDSVSPPITLNVASKSSTANAKRESPQDNSAKKNKQPEQHARNNSSTVDYFDSPSVSIPGPALQPERVGNMIPKKKRAHKAYKPDEPDPFADEFAVEEEFSSPEEKDDHDDEKIVEEQRREKPHEKEDGKKTRVDKGKARAAIHDAQEEEEEEEEEEDEEEEEEEATTTRKDEQHNDKEKDEHDTATTKRDELPEGFNPADYFDEHDLVDLNAPSDYGSDEDDVSSCDEDQIATEEKAEVTTTTTTSRPKSMGYATRIEPGGASMIGLSSFNKDKKDSVCNRRRSDSASPSVSMMQERLADLLVDASWSEEKTQETQEIVHTPIPTLSHSRSRSMSSLYPPDGSFQVSLHLPPSTPYMPGGGPVAQPLYSRVGTPYMMHGGNVYMDQRYIRDVPSNEYGYYKVQPEQSNNNNNSSSVDVSASNDTKDKPKAEKQLPKIPKSDPNHRHITVPSINPGQRVWIRVKPTDTGRELANRIHIVATYKTRKILKITTANGTDVPLDDTPVFEDWNEIEKLQDGAPWKVEWGPMDRDLFGGRQLLRHIKAGLRAAGKE